VVLNLHGQPTTTPAPGGQPPPPPGQAPPPPPGGKKPPTEAKSDGDDQEDLKALLDESIGKFCSNCIKKYKYFIE